MKTTRIGPTLIAGFTLVLTIPTAAPTPALAQTGSDLFQQALVKEQAEGDLQGAITLYERIVRNFSSDRTLSANALVQIGQCYERLGSQEAERAYQRVVRDYPEQTEIVTRARARLAALQRAEPTGIVTRELHVWRHGERSGLSPTPDGRQLVAMDWETGNLVVRDLETGRSRFLTRDATWGDPEQWASSARVSPDGHTVAYTWVTGPEASLRLIGIDGSSPRVLYEKTGCWIQEGPVWSSDSENVLAWESCDETQRVLALPVGGGSPRVVTTLPADRRYAEGTASLSADGRYVVYGSAAEENAGRHDVWLLALESGTTLPLVQHTADDRLLGWVPETSEVVFLSDRDGRWDVWAVSVEDGNPSGLPRLVRRGLGKVWPTGFTRDGALFFDTDTRRSSLSVAPVDLAGGTMDEASAVAILGSNFQPTWSPDGESLAFVQEQVTVGPPWEGPFRRPLRIRNLSTGEEREVPGLVQTRTPRWSPDGRSILLNARDVTNTDPEYQGGLYRLDVETSQVTPVVEVREGTPWWYGISGVWSRDSRSIIYAMWDDSLGTVVLVRHDLEAGSERELYRNPLLTTRLLAVSPDGSRLAFALRNSVDEGSVGEIRRGGRLLTMELASGEVRELHAIREPGDVGTLQWSPDGTYILFAKTEPDYARTGAWRVPADGGDAELLWTFGEDQFAGTFDLNPDGTRAAVMTFTQESEAWVMENLADVLKANDGSASPRGSSALRRGS